MKYAKDLKQVMKYGVVLQYIPTNPFVKDCYIFSCYTGYAYSDAAALTPNDIAIGIDGEKWIIRDRIKTDTTENVPLLPIPLEIISKYRKHTFATTVLLLNAVPMETAMELLGHSDIRTTQIYGKIVQKKISVDMLKLKDKLSISSKKSRLTGE